MKKFLVLAVALPMLVACTTPTTTTNREATNTNTATKAAVPLTEAEAIAKEKEIWGLFEKKDYTTFGNMLDDQVIAIGSDGVSDKAATMKNINGFVPSDVVFSDWKFLPIGKDAAVLVYKVQYKATANGQPIPPQSTYASTGLVNRNGKWLGIYHQETEVAKQPPPPPPHPKKETTAPSPSASAAATSADAEANEKLVWDALKKKNYDAFASYLAPESIEVESNGIMDKAGSIKGVQGFDLSKSELSDWKVVRFDNEAALVTYVARFPGQTPEREYHSTIWANRSGKWLAVFHQGTPLMPPPKASPSPAKSK